MPARVTLSATAGPLLGRELVFDERTTCIAGRAQDCEPQIVERRPTLTSRHHCLFDVNPPDLRVRDLGSLNGTRVNGVEIGRRKPGQTPEEGARLQYFPASETVWALGGMRLSRPVDAPPKARRMLLFMLARYRELDEPRDGVLLSHAELKAALWPEDGDPQIRSDGAVANVAWELRAALGDDDQRLLQTETGAGYRLVPRP